MKKFFAFLIAAALLLVIGCGATEEPAAEVVEESAAVEAEAAMPAAEVPAEQAPVAEPEEEPAVEAAPEEVEEEPALDEEAYNAALACIGLPVEALYAAVGEPDSSLYGSSCLEQGAEDGSLMYDRYGFSVFSLRNENGETVKDVMIYGE